MVQALCGKEFNFTTSIEFTEVNFFNIVVIPMLHDVSSEKKPHSPDLI